MVRGKKKQHMSTYWVRPAGAQLNRLASAKKHGVQHPGTAPVPQHTGGGTGGGGASAAPAKSAAAPKSAVAPKGAAAKKLSSIVAKRRRVQGKEQKLPKEDRELPKPGPSQHKLHLSEQTKRLADVKAGAEAKRVWTDKKPEGFPDQTIHKYPLGPDGQVKDMKRKVLHEAIAHEYLDKVKPVAKGEQKVAIMTMGAPSSGKSSALDVDEKKFVAIDPDSIKDHLPEFKAATNPKRTWRKAAAMAHEESSALAKEIQRRAIAQEKNVLVDGTGHDADSYIKKMETLKKAGYEVNVRMPDLDLETGMQRMTKRAENKGRYVPDEKVEAAYHDIPKNMNKIMAMADTFKMVDNRGRPARLVIEKKLDGTIVIHDKAFMADFYKRHPQND